MKLNEKSFALASGVIGAILAFICTVLIRFLPASTMGLYSWAIHFDLTAFASLRQVSWSNFFGGIIIMFLVSYIVGWVFARLYNRFSAEKVSQ